MVETKNITSNISMQRMKQWFAASKVPAMIVTAIASVSLPAYAQTTGNVSGNVYDANDLGLLFCKIIDTMFWILIIVSVIMILVAAFNYVTAGEDTEKTRRATRTLTYAAVGIAVALIAGGFPEIIASVFPNPTGSVSIGSNCAPF